MTGSVDFYTSGPVQSHAGQRTEPCAQNKTQTGESFASLAMKEAEHTPGVKAADAAPDGKKTASNGNLVLHMQGSDGYETTLYWGKDILASVGGRNGSVNVKYHESSTAEDPVVVIWGKAGSGRDYEMTVHLNEIQPDNASPAEMIALNAHLAKTGNREAAKAGPIALWTSMERTSPDTRMDFTRYYEEYIAMQAAGGNRYGANLYRLQMEELLFAHRQGEEEAAVF